MEVTTFVLVPGYWLGGWAWERVTSRLTAAGHHVVPVTLPGMESAAADRSRITLEDQVDAVADAVAGASAPPVLVAHSGAGRLVSGVLDRDPDAVRRVVYVDSGPAADGTAPDSELPAELTEFPLPGWDELRQNGASLDGLSEDDLATFRAGAIPQPVAPGREPIRLSNDRRRQVPTTLVACSFPAATVLDLAATGHPMFAEVATLTDLTTVDLPTGHWPMWSRPEDLADVLLGTVSS